MENVEFPFESPEKGFEALVVNHTDENRLKEFFNDKVEVNTSRWMKNIIEYLGGKKGFGAIADLLATCEKDEIPEFITSTLSEIKRILKQKGTALSASENNLPDK